MEERVVCLGPGPDALTAYVAAEFATTPAVLVFDRCETSASALVPRAFCHEEESKCTEALEAARELMNGAALPVIVVCPSGALKPVFDAPTVYWIPKAAQPETFSVETIVGTKSAIERVKSELMYVDESTFDAAADDDVLVCTMLATVVLPKPTGEVRLCDDVYWALDRCFRAQGDGDDAKTVANV